METIKRDSKGRFLAANEAEAGRQPAKKKKKAKKRTKNCRRFAKKRVSEEWSEIVDGLVKNAKSGSYNHTKLLVEVSGIKEEDVAEAKGKKQGSVTKMLMKKLTAKDEK